MEHRDALPAGRQGFFKHQLVSFSYAAEGIVHSFKKGIHFKIQTLLAVVVIIAAIFYKINHIEWLIIILISSAILAAEAINTAIEETADVLHPEHHPRVKLAKHCAAGGVLILSVAAIFIALIIFVPKIFS